LKGEFTTKGNPIKKRRKWRRRSWIRRIRRRNKAKQVV
jgi:hypothetical protein